MRRFLALTCVLGCNHQRGENRDKKERPPALVRVHQATRAVTPKVFRMVAVLAGRKQATVVSPYTGRMASFAGKEGDRVRRGETLFRVDRSDPGQTFLDAPVASPITGWIGSWGITTAGDSLTAGQPVAVVLDDDAVRVTLYLPSGDWNLVRRDSKATFEVDGQTRSAQVVSISRAADMASGQGYVLLEADNAAHTWKSGMVARVVLELDPRPRILIPAAALTITDQGAHVYLAGDGVATRRPVQFSLIDQDTVEVITGLSDLDRVVTDGANLLSDGAKIRVDAPHESH